MATQKVTAREAALLRRLFVDDAGRIRHTVAGWILVRGMGQATLGRMRGKGLLSWVLGVPAYALTPRGLAYVLPEAAARLKALAEANDATYALIMGQTR